MISDELWALYQSWSMVQDHCTRCGQLVAQQRAQDLTREAFERVMNEAADAHDLVCPVSWVAGREWGNSPATLLPEGDAGVPAPPAGDSAEGEA